MNRAQKAATLLKDSALQNALAKMLPKEVDVWSHGDTDLVYLTWKRDSTQVRETELLHLCALAEATLPADQAPEYERQIARQIWQEDKDEYWQKLGKDIRMMCLHATWQQRATALAKVQGIEV